MNLRSNALSCLAAAYALASVAIADGREPGSLLVYPIHEDRAPFFKDEEGLIQVGGQIIQQPVFTIVSVTNTQRAGSGTTDVYFQYVNVLPSFDPFLFADCSISDRVETLTPADTLSVLTSCHNGTAGASGYLVVTAQNPDAVDTPWSFNHLIGSEQIVSLSGAMYALEAVPFRSPQPYKAPTDVDADTRRTFDGVEYEQLPDELYLDSYVGAISGDLILVSFTGPEYLTNVDLIIYNDDEFQLSAQLSFSCWARIPLFLVSGFFTDAGLSTTANDPSSLDLDCDFQGDLETGWAILRPTNAISPTSAPIADPAVLGATSFPFSPFMNGRLLWESSARQATAAFPN